MFEYLSFEDLKPHLLILIPIIAMFFIACIKKSKNWYDTHKGHTYIIDKLKIYESW